MADLDGGWFKQPGVYGTTERVKDAPRVRRATAMENRRLSKQPEFTFFLPYLPLAICPSIPDVAAEFCDAYGRSIELVFWKLDYPLMPSLAKREIDTAGIFGVAGEDGKLLMNFAQGIVLQDEGARLIYRLIVDRYRLLEPGVSLARPMEKLLAEHLDIHVIGVQSPTSLWTAVPHGPSKQLSIHRNDNGGDPALWKLMKRFWRRGTGTLIIT